MTLQELEKFLDKYEQQSAAAAGSTDLEELKLFRGLPFYNWDDPTDTNTFNHVLGLPLDSVTGEPRPLYRWQYDYLVKHLETKKYNWVLKATGIGLSEIALRWILYKSLVNNKWSGGIVPIFTGVNYDLARRLITRTAEMLYPHFGLSVRENERTIRINNVEITAFAGGHMDTARSLTNCRMFFIDEFDFFEEEKNKEGARSIAERQIAKSDVDILIASTPNRPDGPMKQIQDEEPSIYNKIFLPYTLGVGTMYSQNMTVQKQSPSFPREYELQYLGGIGNLFSQRDIDIAVEKGEKVDLGVHEFTKKSLGIDPGEIIGVVLTEWINNEISVVHVEEYHRLNFNDCVDLILDLIDKYNMNRDNSNIFLDGSNPNLCRRVMQLLGQNTKYLEQMDKLRKQWGKRYGLDLLKSALWVVPINFSTEHKQMLAHCKEALEYDGGNIAINQKFNKLIIALRTATSKGELDLDKGATSHDDILDALRLSLCYYS